MFRNRKEKKNCHYRDCGAITDNLSRIENKKRNVIARSAQVRTSKRSVMPILPAGKIQGIFKLNKIIGRSLEKIFKKIFRDDIIFLFAEILGSKLSFCPRMTEKRRCPKMTFSTFILATLLSFSIISESRADCPAGQVEGVSTHTCIEASGTCGDNCTYTIDATGQMTISGSGDMADYKHSNGCYYDSQGNLALGEKYGSNLKSVVFAEGSNISRIGKRVFQGATGLSSINIPDTVTGISEYAFSRTSLKNITIPDSVTRIETRAFSYGDTQNPTSLEQIIIPDSVTFVGNSAFGANFEQLNNIEIICKGNQQKCANVLSKYEGYVNNATTYEEMYPVVNLSKNMSPASYNNCNSTNFYWNGAECVREPDVSKRKCCNSCKDMGGYCNRIRYTPAEAAAILNDNNNTITITFKK